ncbi:MAG: hypothetical protein DRO98_00625 [Archaeoglobales archaeon]|nr:MAG: hypothetical protein DRO98_00625 [Archaeoglobales archaeon]
MEQRETRIAGLHFSDARPVVGEEIVIAGYLQWYDRKGKMWVPVEHKKVTLYVDNVKVAESVTDHSGRFEFRQSFSFGEHSIDAKFEGSPGLEASQASKKIKVITAQQREGIRRLVRNVVIAALVLLGAFIVVSVLISSF